MMNELWTPAFWNNLTVGAVGLIVAAFIVWALVTERIVIGKTHRAIIARYDARADKDAAAIATLANVVMKQSGTGSEVAQVLTSFRDAVEAED